MLYTENAFVKFENDVKARQIRELLAKYRLTGKRALGYARNAWFVGAKEGIGLEVFGLIARVLKDDAVELAHPELVRRMSHKAAFPQQWHLKRTRVGNNDVDAHANVEAAWALTQGAGSPSPSSTTASTSTTRSSAPPGKIVAPRDATLRHATTRGPRPRRATTAPPAPAWPAPTAAIGASGVAPAARLMPIRLASGLGSQHEADAFEWAADHGADVISCSWGPADGALVRPRRSRCTTSVVPLPDRTRLAIDYAITKGRGGKGCVVLFAAGNGNESVDNDGYASYREGDRRRRLQRPRQESVVQRLRRRASGARSPAATSARRAAIRP